MRNLPVFSRFLDAAALSDGELVNFANIARECGVSPPTVKGHFGILEDTLLGRWLPAYTKRPKRRVIGAPKFYFSDVGIVNHLARRGTVEPGGELFGQAFENWVFHEISAANAYGEHDVPLSYWRLASGIEVDFILGSMKVAIESEGRRARDDRPSEGPATPQRRSSTGATHPRLSRAAPAHDERRHRDPAGGRVRGLHPRPADLSDGVTHPESLSYG